MPSIDINFIKSSLKNRKLEEFPVFIETGTYKGGTIFHMSKHFNELYTIEVANHLYKDVVEKYNQTKLNNINFILGDSCNVLPKLLPKITNKSIVFLDGHFSSLNTGKGDKDVPLYEEVSAIMSFHKNECIIIIDDIRLVGTDRNEDWSDISIDQILEITKPRQIDSFYLPSRLNSKDRLIIHLTGA